MNKPNKDNAARRIRDSKVQNNLDQFTEETPTQREEDFANNLMRESMESLDNHLEQKKRLNAVKKNTHPMGIVFNAVKDGAGKAFGRTLPGKFAKQVHEMLKEGQALQHQIEAENARNAIVTTIVATGACSLANHFEKLHIITAPIVWVVNILAKLLGHKTPVIITKVITYKKTEYLALGVQMQYQVFFMIGILGLSWYLSFRIICWFKNIVSPDERLKM